MKKILTLLAVCFFTFSAYASETNIDNKEKITAFLTKYQKLADAITVHNLTADQEMKIALPLKSIKVIPNYRPTGTMFGDPEPDYCGFSAKVNNLVTFEISGSIHFHTRKNGEDYYYSEEENRKRCEDKFKKYSS